MEQKTKIRIISAIGIISILLIAGYYLGIRNLHDNGGGAEPVRVQLEQAGDNQSEITSELRKADTTVTELRGEIHQATESATEINQEERESGKLIGECKSILKTVRNRGKTHKAEN